MESAPHLKIHYHAPLDQGLIPLRSLLVNATSIASLLVGQTISVTALMLRLEELSGQEDLVTLSSVGKKLRKTSLGRTMIEVALSSTTLILELSRLYWRHKLRLLDTVAPSPTQFWPSLRTGVPFVSSRALVIYRLLKSLLLGLSSLLVWMCFFWGWIKKLSSALEALPEWIPNIALQGNIYSPLVDISDYAISQLPGSPIASVTSSSTPMDTPPTASSHSFVAFPASQPR